MTQPRLIAVIDDDEAVREATGDLVRSLGYLVVTFASAEEYLQSKSVNHTACVISDMRLPGMSGAELQNRLSRGPKTPIIFMTAFPEEKTQARALSAGAFGFLRKPFVDDRLVECLKRALAT